MAEGHLLTWPKVPNSLPLVFQYGLKLQLLSWPHPSEPVTKHHGTAKIVPARSRERKPGQAVCWGGKGTLRDMPFHEKLGTQRS